MSQQSTRQHAAHAGGHSTRTKLLDPGRGVGAAAPCRRLPLTAGLAAARPVRQSPASWPAPGAAPVKARHSRIQAELSWERLFCRLQALGARRAAAAKHLHCRQSGGSTQHDRQRSHAALRCAPRPAGSLPATCARPASWAASSSGASRSGRKTTRSVRRRALAARFCCTGLHPTTSECICCTSVHLNQPQAAPRRPALACALPLAAPAAAAAAAAAASGRKEATLSELVSTLSLARPCPTEAEAWEPFPTPFSVFPVIPSAVTGQRCSRLRLSWISDRTASP